MSFIKKIIAGGQTGCDTGALSFALRYGLSHGGWCPRGRKREDGVIPRRFVLRKTPSRGYSQRTQWNVRDSDGTVVFSIATRLKDASMKTAEVANRLGKPCLHIAANGNSTDRAMALRRFIREHRIQVLTSQAHGNLRSRLQAGSQQKRFEHL